MGRVTPRAATAKKSTKQPAKPPTKPPATATRKERANALVEAGRRAEDARAKKGQALLAQMRKLVAQLADRFVELGQTLRVIFDEQLFVAVGYETFEAMLEAEKLISRSQAYKLMAVAAVFEQADIRDFGVERAVALIAYTRATPEDDDPAELLRRNATIGADATQPGTPVRDATLADLQRARRDALAAAARGAPPAEAKKARERAEKAVAKRVVSGAKTAGLPRPEVRILATKVVATWNWAALAPKE